MKMTVMQATQILKRHNKWRSGVSIKMIDPTRLGMAIDVVVDEIEQSPKIFERTKKEMDKKK